MGLLVAALCAAAGCTGSKQIASVDGPLTPYSPHGCPTGAAGPRPAAGGAATPCRADWQPPRFRRAARPIPTVSIPPRSIPTCSIRKRRSPRLFERMQEVRSPKKVIATVQEDDRLAGRTKRSPGTTTTWRDLYFREGDYEKAAEAIQSRRRSLARFAPARRRDVHAGRSYFQMNQYPRRATPTPSC